MFSSTWSLLWIGPLALSFAALVLWGAGTLVLRMTGPWKGDPRVWRLTGLTAASLWCWGVAAVLALALALGGRLPLWTSKTIWFSLAGLLLVGSLLLCRVGRLAGHLYPSKNHA